MTWGVVNTKRCQRRSKEGPAEEGEERGGVAGVLVEWGVFVRALRACMCVSVREKMGGGARKARARGRARARERERERWKQGGKRQVLPFACERVHAYPKQKGTKDEPPRKLLDRRFSL